MTAQKDSAGTGEDITLKGVSKTFATASGPLPPTAR